MWILVVDDDAETGAYPGLRDTEQVYKPLVAARRRGGSTGEADPRCRFLTAPSKKVRANR